MVDKLLAELMNVPHVQVYRVQTRTYGISPRNTTVTNSIFLGIISAR